MVKINFLEEKPIILAALAAKISQTPFEKGSLKKLYQESRKNEKESSELVNLIMEKYHHLIFGDFLPYAITLEEISRFATLYFWRNVNIHNLIFGAGIEASLRVIRPKRYLRVVEDLAKRAFASYQRAMGLGVPEQDARYLLPEGVLTRMIFTAPPRYLIRLGGILKETPLSELKIVGAKIEDFVKKKFRFEIPKERLPSTWRFWGKEKMEGKDLFSFGKSIEESFLKMRVEGSLSMHAQLVRQRLLLCEIESLEEIAKRASFVVPPTFPKKLMQEYKELASFAHQKQMQLIKKRDPNFVYFLLLGQMAKANIYLCGPALFETAKARVCGTAQWEIRNTIGIRLTEKLARYHNFQKEIGPKCWREKRCSEPLTFKFKKAVCPAFKKGGGIWKGNINNLLETLKEKYQKFSI